MSGAPRPDPPGKVLDDYRRKAAEPGLRPVLDSGDEGDVKNAYLDYVHRRALRRLAPALGPRAADLGCGIGRLTALVARDARTVGVDASPELLALARRNLPADVPLVRADLGALPLGSGTLTGALMAFVSLHLDEEAAARAFSEVARVLQPGGVLLLFEHVAPGPESRLYHGVLDRSVPALEALLRGAGLEVARREALKKTPSRAVHLVKRGALPRPLWRFGAWLDRVTAARRLDHADYVECVLVARRPGGHDPGVQDLRRTLASLFVPEPWLNRRRRRGSPPPGPAR